MKWPRFYPENCPPEEAEPASGTFYRLVRHNPPQEKDFKSVFEANPNQFTDIPKVTRCGLSIQKELQDSERIEQKRLERTKKRAPKFKNRQIAVGNLNPTHGMIKHTPSHKYKSHYTWWVPVDAKPWTVFHVIDR